MIRSEVRSKSNDARNILYKRWCRETEEQSFEHLGDPCRLEVNPVSREAAVGRDIYATIHAQ